jgi:ribose transport system permease protein
MSQAPSVTETLTAPATRPDRRARARIFILERPILQLIVLVAVAAWLVVLIPSIATNPRAVTSILVVASLLALTAMGQTFVIILGGVDLTIPGYIMVGAMLAVNGPAKLGLPIGLSALVTMLICGGIGALIGFVCHRWHIPSLVITLGAGAALSGATLFLAGNDFNGTPPDELRALAAAGGNTFGIPVPPIIFIVVACAVVIWLVLTRTAVGRRFYATGVNMRAADLTRINSSLTWTVVYGLCGAITGIAGMFLAGFGGGWAQGFGEPYLFTGLAAVLIGGTTFGSPRGSFTRTIMGAVILTMISTIILGYRLNEAQGLVLYGVIIIVMLTVYGRDRHVRDRF